jgi:hypothetical protein
VPVQRRRAGPELLRQPAHGEALQAVALEQDEGGLDDLLARQRLLLAGRFVALSPPRGVGYGSH